MHWLSVVMWSQCLSFCLCYSFYLSSPLVRSLSALGRVFPPQPPMASLPASAVQAWPSPLENTLLRLVPPLTRTQVLGWWACILRIHFRHVPSVLGHIHSTLGCLNLVFPQTWPIIFQSRVSSWNTNRVTCFSGFIVSLVEMCGTQPDSESCDAFLVLWALFLKTSRLCYTLHWIDKIDHPSPIAALWLN